MSLFAIRSLVVAVGIVPGVFASTLTFGADAASTVSSPATTVGCKPPVNRILQPPRDYRLRESTREYQWNFLDNWNIHTGPALEGLRKGQLRYVMRDLDFTLKIWPNHADALQAMVAYFRAGGRLMEFQPPECYFAEAKRIYADDPAVWAIEGAYFAQKGDRLRAKSSYESALSLAPDSPEIHYNLGLLYYDMGEFEKAREHALIAYSGGYPLPGLRNKLASKGFWK